MNEIKTDYRVVINNKRIYDFYNENKNMNIENMNIFMIDFIEKVCNNMSTDANININSHILSFISENKTQIDYIKHYLSNINENMNKLNTDIANNMIIQFMNLKKEYIDDVKEIVYNNSLTLNEKVSSLMDKNNSHLIDKTTVILNEIIPRNHDLYNKQIQDTFKEFSSSVAYDTSKLVNASNNDSSMKEFIHTFEMKYNSMMQTIQQPIYAFLSASEDRISKNIDILKETSSSSMQTQNKLFVELGDFLGKYKVSTNKGKYGEHQLFNVLNVLFPTAEIVNTTGQKASGDFIMKRNDGSTILFENKEYDYNIPKDEIAKFIRDIDTHNVSGIFISQNSGITFKQNFQIDINKGNVLVYIQHCEYSADKIRLAVDIIDNLSGKIQELNIEDDNKISKELLDDINSDFQAFINKKDEINTLVKDFQKRMSTQLDDIKMPSLAKYLGTKYASVKGNVLLCDNCNLFEASSKQALSAHKRGCCKKAISTVSGKK
jgi:hypothetical protein